MTIMTEGDIVIREWAKAYDDYLDSKSGAGTILMFEAWLRREEAWEDAGVAEVFHQIWEIGYDTGRKDGLLWADELAAANS